MQPLWYSYLLVIFDPFPSYLLLKLIFFSHMLPFLKADFL